MNEVSTSVPMLQDDLKGSDAGHDVAGPARRQGRRSWLKRGLWGLLTAIALFGASFGRFGSNTGAGHSGPGAR